MIMMMASKNTIEELFSGKVVVKYHEVAAEEAWRTDFIKEIVDIRHEELIVSVFNKEQLDEILEYLCSS